MGRGRWQWVWVLALLLAGAFRVAAQDPGLRTEQQYGLYPDFAANLRVRYIGHRLALAAALPEMVFAIYNADELNAFSLADGRIYLSSRLATLLPDDELAFVLGHELTHIQQRHAKQQAQRMLGTTLLGMLLEGVLGAKHDGVAFGVAFARGVAEGHYSRTDEYRADRGGALLMARCGYDPQCAATTMQRLLDAYGHGEARVPVIGWFASHPDSGRRKARLLAIAADLHRHPPPQLAAPVGIAVTLDTPAAHAGEWAHTYLSLILAEYGHGRLCVLPAPAYPIHTLLQPVLLRGADQRGPPVPVTVKLPSAPLGYQVSVSVAQIPAGHAAALSQSLGSAVQATLHWENTATGTAGVCAAAAQSPENVPWMAAQQVAAPEQLYMLADGSAQNVEGTLEATALRRAAMAFVELVQNGKPVDHHAPVKITIIPGKLRPGDYIAVLRGNAVVAEVCIEQISGPHEITGSVLWGVNTWTKIDRFLPEYN